MTPNFPLILNSNSRKSMILGLALSLVSGCGTPILAQLSPISDTQLSQTNTVRWQRMSETEKESAWEYILNSPLGIAALNQLAIEGFISPTCPKTFYTNPQSGGFQMMMQVSCPQPRGVSTAVGYSEIKVIFNRFEDNIEDFRIERSPKEQ